VLPLVLEEVQLLLTLLVLQRLALRLALLDHLGVKGQGQTLGSDIHTSQVPVPPTHPPVQQKRPLSPSMLCHSQYKWEKNVHQCLVFVRGWTHLDLAAQLRHLALQALLLRLQLAHLPPHHITPQRNSVCQDTGLLALSSDVAVNGVYVCAYP
jgi:hypothetical protein